MNVYFIDPFLVKPAAWKPLLTYLKVKASYSFIPTDQLPESLYTIIRHELKVAYSNQDLSEFTDSVVFKLRAHLEKHIRLIPEHYRRISDVPKEELKGYSIFSPFWNIKYIDGANCLILMKLKSSFDSTGLMQVPDCYSSSPTHIANYCLNILRKKYGHVRYRAQSAFIIFDEYMSRTFLYNQMHQRWDSCVFTPKNGNPYNFIKCVYQGVYKLCPSIFPAIEIKGGKFYTSLRTSEGDEKYKAFLQRGKEIHEQYMEAKQREEASNYEGDDIDRLNREFWNECGEAGSNCESWPGWD